MVAGIGGARLVEPEAAGRGVSRRTGRYRGAKYLNSVMLAGPRAGRVPGMDRAHTGTAEPGRDTQAPTYVVLNA